MGFREYEELAAQYSVPVVVTGFEPVDLLQGLLLCVQQLEAGEARVENQYARAVTREGNAAAQALLERVFVTVEREWRGLGPIARSGWDLAPAYSAYDARLRFEISPPAATATEECRSGLVLRGALKPDACPHFGVACTPETPLGATMVSSEGACAAYYRYRSVS
jgi:hydrogenase expression/formation protein HypD